jgi:putative monooxygenase
VSDISVVSLTDVESVLLAGGSWSKVLVSDYTVSGNSSALGYSVFRPHTSTADLSHEVEELAYIVSGSGVIRLEDEDVPVAAGQALYVPARVWHTVVNPGDDDLVMVFAFPSPAYPPTERREPAGTERRDPAGAERRDPAGAEPREPGK